jgi:D-beta-D-heptose 7-phosphate kinase/D-beta-D-heptose 1-phosphate adenosyltransferase
MSEMPLHDLLSALRGQRVVIVGDVMLDEYIWGNVRRISPEAPVPIVEMHRRTFVPGGASNTAANVVSLGGVARLAGAVGQDSYAEQLATALGQAGVDADGLFACRDRQTTAKTRIIAHNQQVVRLDSEVRHAMSEDDESRLTTWVEREIASAGACVISDYAKGVVSARVAEHLIQSSRKLGKPVIVDPKGADYAKYRGATVVKPNIHEAERVTKQEITDDKSLAEVGTKLATLLEGSAVLITRGPQGMSLFRAQEPPIHIPTVAHNVFDVTGAGDTVIGTLAVALAAGASLVQATHLANWAAGIVVGKVGTATVTLDELRDASVKMRF